MRPRLLLIALLAWTLLGSVLAAGNRSLSCSVSGVVAGCMVEVPAFVLGSFEVAVGVDAQLAYGFGRESHFGPYLLVGWYEATWSVFAEFALPASRVPVFGRPDPWRVGVSVRF